jgi:paraquat-inducible protein B
MGTKVNKTAIGAFVLGAIVLTVVAVLVLGAGKFFTREHTYITYFDGSVKGLAVGSPVTFRGVRVGSVTSISIMVDPGKKTLKIPVVFNLEPAEFEGTRAEFQRDPHTIEKAVRSLGLRTQLQSQSFVTGQLVVALDFFPETPPNFVGWNKKYPEIPSIPTPLEQLQKRLESLPLKEIVENLNGTMIEIRRLVKTVDLGKSTQLLEGGLLDLQTLVRHVDGRIDPLVTSLSNASGAAETTLKEADSTLAQSRQHMNDLAVSAQTTLESAQAALKQSEVTLNAYSGESQIQAQMNRTLRELNATLRALRRLSDSLERHPESLLRGKRRGSEE